MREDWPAYEQSSQPIRPPMFPEIEWFADVQPVLEAAYLVKGILDQGAMSVMYGSSNCGKTFLALDIAYHIAAGHPWRGRRVTQGGVLYLAAEGGHGIANRIAALRRQHGENDIPFALRRAGLDLLRPDADVERLIELISELQINTPISLIVIDTLSRAIAGGDENTPKDMTAFVANVDHLRRATGAHVLIIHHSGKDAAKGARGHSSLRAATDTEIEVTADGTARSADVQKQRDNPGGESFAFTLASIDMGHDQDGDPVTSCIVEHDERAYEPAAKRKQASLTPKEKNGLKALTETLLSHGEPPPPSLELPRNLKVVKIDRWRDEMFRSGVIDRDASNPRTEFSRIRNGLTAKERAAERDGFIWVP